MTTDQMQLNDHVTSGKTKKFISPRSDRRRLTIERQCGLLLIVPSLAAAERVVLAVGSPHLGLPLEILWSRKL
jgi:hypothetical protein